MASAPKSRIGDLVDVDRNEAFDEGVLRDYLESAISEFHGPVTVRQFEGGQSNPTYKLETRDADYVLRRKPPGPLPRSAHAVDREFRVMSALHKEGLPIAEPLVLCEDEDVIGSMFYIMRFVPGRVFWDPKMPELTPDERSAVYDSANETLARLHCVDYDAIGLGDYGRPGDYFARQISRWSRQYEEAKTDEIPEMEALMEWLPGAIPEGDEHNSIIHGDYSFHNLIVHPTEPKVVSIVDWELSTLGNPVGDLTYHMMEWFRPEGVDVRGTLKGADLKALGIPDARSYADAYRRRTGFDVDPMNPFYRTFHLFRIAAILQGISGRIRDGVQKGDNSKEIVTRIRPLAQAAWKEAQAQ